jgi:hypothetical protein
MVFLSGRMNIVISDTTGEYPRDSTDDKEGKANLY